MRMGQNEGALPGKPLIALMPLGPWLLLSFLPPALILNLSVQFILGLGQMPVLEAATFTFVVLMT